MLPQMRLIRRFGLFLLLLFCAVELLSARVVRVEVTSRKDVLNFRVFSVCGAGIGVRDGGGFVEYDERQRTRRGAQVGEHTGMGGGSFRDQDLRRNPLREFNAGGQGHRHENWGTGGEELSEAGALIEPLVPLENLEMSERTEIILRHPLRAPVKTGKL